MELINNLSLLLVSYVAISSVANLFSSVEGRVMYKTIKTEYGSIYDCVDIYKQPAFDHPLLRNHKIQMRPSFALQRMPNNTSSTGTTKYGLKNECPRGTVPIRRMSKEEQLRSDFSFTQELGQSSTGFEVNPDLFGDNRTRLYTIWGQGVDGVMHGCYDTRCPGFVIVSTQIPLNVVFKDISVAGGSQFYVKLSIAQQHEIDEEEVVGKDKKNEDGVDGLSDVNKDRAAEEKVLEDPIEAVEFEGLTKLEGPAAVDEGPATVDERPAAIDVYATTPPFLILFLSLLPAEAALDVASVL
ncbi:hypothetical protein ACOSP7_009589 [Xanthoceras sorbifolium]